MSRSGYNDDCYDNWAHIRWRGAVAQAIRSYRGQAFLKELLAALDALPEKRLVENVFEDKGEVCTLGAIAKARGTDVSDIDIEDEDGVSWEISRKLGMARALAAEIMCENDEASWYGETPEERFVRVRKWIVSQIRKSEEE